MKRKIRDALVYTSTNEFPPSVSIWVLNQSERNDIFQASRKTTRKIGSNQDPSSSSLSHGSRAFNLSKFLIPSIHSGRMDELSTIGSRSSGSSNTTVFSFDIILLSCHLLQLPTSTVDLSKLSHNSLANKIRWSIDYYIEHITRPLEGSPLCNDFERPFLVKDRREDRSDHSQANLSRGRVLSCEQKDRDAFQNRTIWKRKARLRENLDLLFYDGVFPEESRLHSKEYLGTFRFW